MPAENQSKQDAATDAAVKHAAAEPDSTKKVAAAPKEANNQAEKVVVAETNTSRFFTAAPVVKRKPKGQGEKGSLYFYWDPLETPIKIANALGTFLT